MKTPALRKNGNTVFPRSLATACAALALLASTACQAKAGTLLSYWDFNNESLVYSGSTIGSFSTTDAGYGEVYTSASKFLSANSTLGLYTASRLDFSGLVGTVNSGNTGATGWGAYKDASTNLAASQTSNLYAGDASTQQGALLMLINNTGGTSLTDSLTFSLDTAGYQGISLSYAGRYGNTNPVLSWSYSTDNGTTWTGVTPTKTGNLGALGSYYDLVYSFGNALDNQSAVSLKMSFTLVAGASTSYAIDNLQVLAASAVPEVPIAPLLGLSLAACWLGTRFRRNTRQAALFAQCSG